MIDRSEGRWRMFDLQIEPFEFDYEMEEEWETGSPNRSSPSYIKWMQGSLNQILGLKLATDGDLGAQTRSAIRSFQQKQGLKVMVSWARRPKRQSRLR